MRGIPVTSTPFLPITRSTSNRFFGSSAHLSLRRTREHTLLHLETFGEGTQRFFQSVCVFCNPFNIFSTTSCSIIKYSKNFNIKVSIEQNAQSRPQATSQAFVLSSVWRMPEALFSYHSQPCSLSSGYRISPPHTCGGSSSSGVGVSGSGISLPWFAVILLSNCSVISLQTICPDGSIDHLPTSPRKMPIACPGRSETPSGYKGTASPILVFN